MGKKKAKEAEKENAERWLLTYADLITLLLVLFIVLYSMASVETKKFNAMSKSLAATFRGMGTQGILKGGISVISRSNLSEGMSLEESEERLNRLVESLGLSNQVTTSKEKRGLVISIKDSVLFTSGSASLTEGAESVVRRVGLILALMNKPIRIEGYTDNDPMRAGAFYSNWELSTSRATHVLQYLIANTNIKPEQIYAAGYGEFRPKVANDSPENKAKNRRVDIVVISDEAAKFEPPTETK